MAARRKRQERLDGADGGPTFEQMNTAMELFGDGLAEFMELMAGGEGGGEEGSAAAAAVSIDLILAWACGLRTKAACSMRGKVTSSTNRDRPRASRGALGRGTVRPI